MESSGNLDVSVPVGPRAAALAIAAAREFLNEGPCDGDMQARLAIIVEELVLNIIEHGCPPADDVIAISFLRADRNIRLAIEDGGAFFDPRDAGPRMEFPPDRGGGAGLALVLAWADILLCERRDGRNRLVLDIRG